MGSETLAFAPLISVAHCAHPEVPHPSFLGRFLLRVGGSSEWLTFRHGFVRTVGSGKDLFDDESAILEISEQQCRK